MFQASCFAVNPVSNLRYRTNFAFMHMQGNNCPINFLYASCSVLGCGYYSFLLYILGQVDGVRKATPLLLCLLCIEMSDFVFAVDSIPAVLGISHDTFIVYTSNVSQGEELGDALQINYRGSLTCITKQHGTNEQAVDVHHQSCFEGMC